MDPQQGWWPERAQTPVVEGERCWYRPDNLLVDVDLEPALPDLLSGVGMAAQRQVPGRNDEWRLRSAGPGGGPDYGDLNARLAATGAAQRLWVVTERSGELHRAVAQLRSRGVGVYLNHVFVGEDWYHGGPADEPVAAEGPGTPLPDTGPVDGRVHLAVLDTAPPTDWAQVHPDLIAEIVSWLPGLTIEHPRNEDGDGRLDAQAAHGLFICGLARRVAPQIGAEVGVVLHSSGEGEEAHIAATLAETTAPVVNLSLGGYTEDDAEPVALASAVRQVRARGAVVVAAAGNSRQLDQTRGRRFWPAALADVVAVGAYEMSQGQPALAGFSNDGQLYAPGVGLVSAYVTGWSDTRGCEFQGWARWSGTSFAAPLVAAEIARRVATTGETPEAGWLALKASLGPVAWPDGPAGLLYVPRDGAGQPLDLTRW